MGIHFPYERLFTRRHIRLDIELRRLPSLFYNYAEDTLYHHSALGDVFERRLGARTLYLCHPRLVEQVLVHRAGQFRKGRGYEAVRGVLGEGVFASNGETWSRQRRLLDPEFSTARLESQLPALHEELDGLTARWWGTAMCNVPLPLERAVGEFSLRLLGATMLQSSVGDSFELIARCMRASLEQSTRRLLSGGLLQPWMPTPGNIRARRAERQMSGAIDQLIAEARTRPEAQPEPGGGRAQRPDSQGRCPFGFDRAGSPEPAADEGRRGLLEAMLTEPDPRTGEAMSDSQLQALCRSLMFAGHGTIALTITWALMCALEDPAVEAKIVAEVRRVLAGRLPTLEDISRLVYTRQVILETLRLFPPIPAVSREARVSGRVLGVDVREGEMVTIPVYVLHRHRQFWRDPERFDPERWGPERPAPDPFAYMPFLRGERSCPADSLAILTSVACLATIIDRFELRRLAAGPLRARARICLHPDPSPRVQVYPRSR